MQHKNSPKIGDKETVMRIDNRLAVYQYMVDPNLTKEDLERAARIEYFPSRWVLVDVIENHHQ